MSFLKDCWYVAAWDHEVGERPLARTLLGEDVVLFRAPDGRAVALEDRCPHRGVPLSMGEPEGGGLRCRYHGLLFDRDGACVAVPGQTRVPPGAAVRSWPLVERWHWLWIWMGDPARADPDLIPDWWWLDHPDWELVRGKHLHIRCHYELITDNLLDLSHLAYVHPATIGTEAIAEFPISTELGESSVLMTRWILDRAPPPLFAAVGGFRRNVDRWQIVETRMPCHTLIRAGCVAAGLADPDRGEPEGGIHIRNVNAPTPETETSTFYFYGHARDFALGDAGTSETMFAQFARTFDEDAAILEAQQRSIDRAPDRKTVDINVDAPGLAARRLLRERLCAERARAR